MSSTTNVAAAVLTAVLVLFVLGYGLLIEQQLLLSVLLALLVVLVYVWWR